MTNTDMYYTIMKKNESTFQKESMLKVRMIGKTCLPQNS